jgi:hypothetical protein
MTERRYFGRRLTTSDLASGSVQVAQKFSLSGDRLLLVARVWLIFYNNPTLSSLALKVYSDRNGSPGKLLATSASRKKAALITEANGAREVYFEFNAPSGIMLSSGTSYHLVLAAEGYAGDEVSHIAWRKAWSDPVYGPYTATFENLAVSPYALTLVAAEVLE